MKILCDGTPTTTWTDSTSIHVYIPTASKANPDADYVDPCSLWYSPIRLTAAAATPTLNSVNIYMYTCTYGILM